VVQAQYEYRTLAFQNLSVVSAALMGGLSGGLGRILIK